MKIILASKSGVRKKILDKYNIENEVIPSNVDEDEVKTSLLAVNANPLLATGSAYGGPRYRCAIHRSAGESLSI